MEMGVRRRSVFLANVSMGKIHALVPCHVRWSWRACHELNVLSRCHKIHSPLEKAARTRMGDTKVALLNW